MRHLWTVCMQLDSSCHLQLDLLSRYALVISFGVKQIWPQFRVKYYSIPWVGGMADHLGAQSVAHLLLSLGETCMNSTHEIAVGVTCKTKIVRHRTVVYSSDEASVVWLRGSG